MSAPLAASTQSGIAAPAAPVSGQGQAAVQSAVFDADSQRFVLPLVHCKVSAKSAAGDAKHLYWELTENVVSQTAVAYFVGRSTWAWLESAELLVERGGQSWKTACSVLSATLTNDDKKSDEATIRASPTFQRHDAQPSFPGVPWASFSVPLSINQWGTSAYIAPGWFPGRRPLFAFLVDFNTVCDPSGETLSFKENDSLARVNLVVVVRRSNTQPAL